MFLVIPRAPWPRQALELSFLSVSSVLQEPSSYITSLPLLHVSSAIWPAFCLEKWSGLFCWGRGTQFGVTKAPPLGFPAPALPSGLCCSCAPPRLMVFSQPLPWLISNSIQDWPSETEETKTSGKAFGRILLRKKVLEACF